MVSSVFHPSQLEPLLGISGSGDPLDVPSLAEHVVLLLHAWRRLVSPLDWEVLVEPTPARGRSIHELVVNSHEPFSLLPEAWRTGDFPWVPEDDHMRLATLRDRGEFLDYVERIDEGWAAFVAEARDRLGSRDPVLRTVRGTLLFSVTLSSQRWHAAFHLRQAVVHLDARKIPNEGLDVFASMPDLQLPDNVYI